MDIAVHPHLQSRNPSRIEIEHTGTTQDTGDLDELSGLLVGGGIHLDGGFLVKDGFGFCGRRARLDGDEG